MNNNETNNNPFLCQECTKHGFCYLDAKVSVDEYPVCNEKEITLWVPLQTRRVYVSKAFSFKVQCAHDLFHQGEYKESSFMYRDLLTKRLDSDEVIIGLMTSLYFLQAYEEAASIAQLLETNYKNNPDNFINLCMLKFDGKAKEFKKNKSTECINIPCSLADLSDR